jgi:CDP-diacylglycerol---serine O-phosphatidyltransferase
VTGAARRRLQRGVVVLPSAFTLGNLFLGVWAVVSASRGQFETAGWLIVWAAVMDMLDGRIARYTSTGSDFGEQLDSLVDAISFGLAPALIVYFIYFADGTWSWTIVFLYVAAAIIRLARFNVEQAGVAKSNFHGLPSPTAGMTLATFYPFTQTAFFQDYLAGLRWSMLTPGLVLGVSVLMVSHVLYPVVPRFSTSRPSGIIAIALAIVSIIAAVTVPALFFFPAAVIYIGWGLARSAVAGFQDRLPDRDPLIDVDEDEDEAGEDNEIRELEYEEFKRRPRKHAGGEPPKERF